MTPSEYYYGPFRDHFDQFWRSLDTNRSVSRVRSRYNPSRFSQQSDLHFSTFDLVANPANGFRDHLADIPKSSYIDFICALFSLILIDQVMYSHRKPDYAAFQALTRYPKADRTVGYARRLMMANPYELFSDEILQSRGIEPTEIDWHFSVWAAFIVQDMKSFFTTHSVGGSTWDVVKTAMLSDSACFAGGRLGAFLRRELESEVGLQR
jgi:hypothetical protein